MSSCKNNVLYFILIFYSSDSSNDYNTSDRMEPLVTDSKLDLLADLSSAAVCSAPMEESPKGLPEPIVSMSEQDFPPVKRDL